MMTFPSPLLPLSSNLLWQFWSRFIWWPCLCSPGPLGCHHPPVSDVCCWVTPQAIRSDDRGIGLIAVLPHSPTIPRVTYYSLPTKHSYWQTDIPLLMLYVRWSSEAQVTVYYEIPRWVCVFPCALLLSRIPYHWPPSLLGWSMPGPLCVPTEALTSLLYASLEPLPHLGSSIWWRTLTDTLHTAVMPSQPWDIPSPGGWWETDGWALGLSAFLSDPRYLFPFVMNIFLPPPPLLLPIPHSSQWWIPPCLYSAWRYSMSLVSICCVWYLQPWFYWPLNFPYHGRERPSGRDIVLFPEPLSQTFSSYTCHCSVSFPYEWEWQPVWFDGSALCSPCQWLCWCVVTVTWWCLCDLYLSLPLPAALAGRVNIVLWLYRGTGLHGGGGLWFPPHPARRTFVPSWAWCVASFPPRGGSGMWPTQVNFPLLPT